MAVFGAIGVAIKAVSSWTIGLGSLGTFAVGNFILRSAVQLGVSALAKAFGGDGDQREGFAIQGSVRTGGNVPRSLLIGPAVTAGSLVWHSEWGREGDTPNAYYTQVIALSDLPVKGFLRWFADSQRMTLAATESEFGFAAEEYTKDGVEHAWVKFHDGNQIAADPFLTGTVSAGAPRTYEPSRVGFGVAYAIVTFRVNEEFFTGFPRSKFVVDGVPLYDVSRDSTAGGTGPQRWENPSTWGGDGDALPAVQGYNFARGVYYRRDTAAGGLSASGTIPLDAGVETLTFSLVAGGGGDGADGGATTVRLLDGETEVQSWTVNGGLATSEARYTNAEDAEAGVSQFPPHGNGAPGQVEVFEGGAEGSGVITPGIAGGTAGEYLEVTGYDVSGLNNPSLDVVIGSGGPGARDGFVEYNGSLAAASVQTEWFYGLQGLTAARLPSAHWITQIEKCRTPIDGPDGPEPTYRSAGEITVNSEIGAAFDAILTTCAGRMSEVGGVFKMYVGAPDAPIAHFTDDDILSIAPQTFTPFFGLNNTVNGAIATYPSPDDAYAMRSTPPVYNPTFEAEDGGRRLLTEVTLSLVPFPGQAQRVLQGELDAARRARRHTHSLPARYRLIEPGDVVSWDSARNGYESKWFRVDGVIDLPNCDLVVDLTEVDPSDHGSWVHDDDYRPVTPSAQLPQRPVPQQIAGWSVEPWYIEDSAGNPRLPAILVKWDASVTDVAAVWIQVRLWGATGLVFDGRIEGVSSGQGVVSQSILSEARYEVRGKYIPGTPRETEWSGWLSVETGDYRVSAADMVDELNEKINAAFDRHDQTLETVTSGAVFDLLKETRITDAILAAQAVNENARQAVNFEENEGNRAAIIQEQIERLDGDDALASLITLLTARVGTAESDIIVERAARIDGDTASANDRAALLVRIDDNEGAITNEAQTRAAQDAVNASLSSALGVRMDGAEGDISNLSATKVDASGAVTAVESEITASYGGLTAMASATFFAEAHASRVNSGYVLRLNGSNVFEVVSAQDGTGGPTQTFRLDADYVQITGLTQIDSAVLGQIAADNGFISNLLVDTLQIAGNAVTIPVSGVGTNLVGNGNWQGGVNIAINLPIQSDVLLLWSIEQGYFSTIPTWGYQLRNNVSGLVYDEREGMTFGNDQPTGQWLLLDQPAGIFRAQLRWKGQNSNISGIPHLTVLVVKR